MKRIQLSELVVVMKGGRKQKNVIGAVMAVKSHPPFTERRNGYHLRWWGPGHPVSWKIRRTEVGK